MEKEFIPYQQALELKILGFDEPSFGWYWVPEDNDGVRGLFEKENIDMFRNSKAGEHFCSAPIWQQAFDWFRENDKLYTCVSITLKRTFGYIIEQYEFPYNLNDVTNFNSYEEARQACLEKLIEIVKNNYKFDK